VSQKTRRYIFEYNLKENLPWKLLNAENHGVSLKLLR